MPAASEKTEDPQQQRTWAAFHYFDRDADSRLNAEEFKKALQAAGLSPSQQDFEQALLETGSNISFVAFKTVVSRLQEKVLTQEAFVSKFKELQAKEGDADAEKQIIHADLP